MQRDIKLGLGVGLFLLVLCGFFYIKMRSSSTKEEPPAESGLEKILVTDKSGDTTSSLERELPPAVRTPPPEPELAKTEKTSTDTTTMTIEPAVEEEKTPNAIGTLGPPTKPVQEKHKKVEKVEKLTPIEPLFPKIPDFPIRKVEKEEPPLRTPAAATAGGKEYVVEHGDTLSRIAADQLGSAKHWKKVFEANKDKLSSPEKLVVGMKITIPEVTPEDEKPAPAKEPALVPPATPEKEKPEAEEGEVHIVKKGETLSDIAEQYLKDRNKWKQIAKANPDIQPDRLQVGQKIKIPKQ